MMPGRLMKKLPIFILLLLMLPCTSLLANTEYNIGKALNDLNIISQGLSNIFDPLGSMSFIGDPVGYSFTPRFTLGVGMSFVLVPLENIVNPEDIGIDYTFEDLSFPYFPIPSIGVFMKWNNVKDEKQEFGLKLVGIPRYDGKEGGYAQNLLFGWKLRRRVIDTELFYFSRFGLSLGIFNEYIAGGVKFAGKTDFPIVADAVPEPVGTLSTETGFETTWEAFTLGVEAQANVKVLLFFNFFTGLRISKTIGQAATALEGNVLLIPDQDVVQEYGIDFDAVSADVTVKSFTEPSGLDYYLFLGTEFKVSVVVITLRTGRNFSDGVITIDGGIRFQF
jgi:hypothetical protein